MGTRISSSPHNISGSVGSSERSVFKTEIDLCTHSKEWDDAIPWDGLEETGSSCQTLKSCSAGGEEGTKYNNPRGRPCQRTYYKVATDPFAKPAGTWRQSSCVNAVNANVRPVLSQVQTVNSWVLLTDDWEHRFRLSCDYVFLIFTENNSDKQTWKQFEAVLNVEFCKV